MQKTISATEALQRLREGNYRFSQNLRAIEAMSTHSKRAELTAGQEPIAVILGCSDSRVPAEIVFDQGLGDLFVIRVAGNIVAPSQVGSVEFAVSQFGTRLVVVLGHSRCGAVVATIDELAKGNGSPSKNISSIVDRVKPAVESLMRTDLINHPAELINEAVRANVRASANQLRHGSAIIENLIATDGLLIVGAEYCLESGVVDFFDGVPSTT
ncbi:MAG: carbonic anhydrase [Gammaproteobacteria bacterium]